jgi:hypothetical protein
LPEPTRFCSCCSASAAFCCCALIAFDTSLPRAASAF